MTPITWMGCVVVGCVLANVFVDAVRVLVVRASLRRMARDAADELPDVPPPFPPPVEPAAHEVECPACASIRCRDCGVML